MVSWRLVFLLSFVMAGTGFLPATRAFLSKLLELGNGPQGAWKLACIILALLSWKNLPLVWHLRFFRALLHQLYVQRRPIPPGSLFEPVITSTRTSLWETDFNFHKSNSTYFSDLDISRTHYMVALLRSGIHASRGSKADSEGPKPNMALGGVSCHFRREIKPFVKFEIWTRLLSWDRKWIYLVSHIIKAGIIKPKSYTLQPWKKGKISKKEEEESAEARKARLKNAVYATSISKYVVKKGRLTIPAETVLAHSNLLPPKPAEAASIAVTAASSLYTTSNGAIKEDLDESFVLADNVSEFTWEKVEAERLRGLRYAEMFGNLDELHEQFEGDVALGRYPDLI